MEIPRHWRLKAQRYRLEGSYCPVCGQFTFPPRPVCPHFNANSVQITHYGISAIPISIIKTDTVSLKVG